MVAVNNSAFSFRVPEKVKTQAFDVIAQYGLTPSQVMNMFLNEIAHTKTIPVSLDYHQPNARTLRSIQDIENGDFEMVDVRDDETLTDALLRQCKG
ncbi:type II toxin-antitoxin system RelB/DinJ family antitoxin [Pasteurella skyensis]|uniref:Type II toxin-antitoxin system RelB/DinJ family antitoxin n=1 Tax=Phocoenobacter skyensis TaxID=97481 RepID=A0AAJ6P176_9PAST|nr:type II toxin-antitoxin system RelB/DinJ family antitoxin [Pasteurella skyensis]MDP8161555.1 type II toxin-antitoxin system RelB/DinJ family antitoxin [Pasteurella skyensis]MDP8173389.1 type II toxin-antitoxin system RelB/DinJ family antitoxin [Pasteurella skyensis]MDP8175949.1 type II toxin-antitoxin system RelB/DinJ family antitoxin [Pasteurella skyensis]MDP8177917.1 type II toxin-antitoxin system RelB/DinJ family antitoxin [Pasteurella skyensis]MDP8182424.1 type II toxin-antitoxin system